MDQEMKVSKEERIQELQEQVKQEEEKKEEAAVALAGRLADILIKADIEEIKVMLSQQASIALNDSAEIISGLKRIKETEEAIMKLKEQIQDVENEGLCPRCHEAVDPSDVFCSVCGYNLKDKEANKMKICDRCGASLPMGAVFCMVCGVRLDGQPAELDLQPPKRICRNCGKELPDGYLFCDNCGTRAE